MELSRNHCEENEISIEQAQLALSLFLRCSRFLWGTSVER